MFLTITRRSGAIAAAALVLTLVLLGMWAAAVFPASADQDALTVVIDAGHGGMDGGVVGTTYGAKECDINLYIAKTLRHFLVKKGINVVMTRNKDVTLSDGKTQNAKLSDMKKRAEIINSSAPDLMISIHQNSYPLAGVCGAQVFYDASSEAVRTAAETFQQTLNDSLGKNRAAKQEEYYVLQCSPYPSVLVECGFLSNPEEERLLLTAAYREKVAYALYTATVLYFDKISENIKNNV